MKLREWQWDQQSYAEVEYPDAPIKAFVDFFRTTKQWRENPEQVFARWMKFERELTEARNAIAEGLAEACTETTKAGEPCRGKVVSGGLCMAHLKASKAA